MTDLKPCPFCGEAPYRNTDTDGVCCRRRGCPGHWVEANTEEWNRRAPDPSESAKTSDTVELVRKLRDALEYYAEANTIYRMRGVQQLAQHARTCADAWLPESAKKEKERKR